MIQRAEEARLAFEARRSLGVAHDGFRQNFDRDFTPKTRIAGAVHLAHASPPQEVMDFVNAQPGSPLQRHQRTAIVEAWSGRFNRNSPAAADLRPHTSRAAHMTLTTRLTTRQQRPPFVPV
jgi:hypothetical protein